MQPYRVSGNSVLDENGAVMYDNLESLQLAHDIALVLNAGIDPEWDAVEAALDRLVVVKSLPPVAENATS